jgi:hypothetical protein
MEKKKGSVFSVRWFLQMKNRGNMGRTLDSRNLPLRSQGLLVLSPYYRPTAARTARHKSRVNSKRAS